MATNSETKIHLLLLLMVMVPSWGFQLRVMRLESIYRRGPNSCSPGHFTVSICTSEFCCRLKNDYREGEQWQMFLVGGQLGHCESFKVENGTTLTITHNSHCSRKFGNVTLRGSLRNSPDEVVCQFLGQSLTRGRITAARCYQKNVSNPDNTHNLACNGRSEFCNLKVGDFTFAGAHNSGTGQRKDPAFPCMYQNHDMNIREQLDFGLRFFDVDINYSTMSLYCHGLETGHGEFRWIYQCFGKVKDYLLTMRRWLNQNPHEVVVVHFGALLNFSESYPRLKLLLKEVFSREGSVKLNTEFQRNGSWPTLGEAIAENTRVFVMIRFEEWHRVTTRENFISVVKIGPNRQGYPKPNLPRGVLSITSTYNGGWTGNHCQGIVDDAKSFCKSLAGDLVRLDAYGTYGGGGFCHTFRVSVCNPRIQEMIGICRKFKPKINFIYSDYPNHHIGSKGLTLPQMTEIENLRKVRA